MIAVDTNVIVRLLAQDNQPQFRKSLGVAESKYELVGSNISGTPPKSPTSEGL